MSNITPAPQVDDATLAQARAEQTRAASVSIVQALYRLIKASSLHADTNDAVASLVRFTQEAVSDYCQKAQVQVVTLHFTTDTAFVNGQMLRASRQAYQSAAELAAVLDKGGVSEVTIPATVGGADISAFARAAVETSRDQANPGRLIDARCGQIRLRKVRFVTQDSAAARKESPQQRIVKTYASAVVVMREFNDQLRRGDYQLPHRLKRIAQRLISHAEEDLRTLVVLAGGKVTDADEGSRAVNTSIIAVAMARQLTQERSLLTALSMAALLLDSGRIRIEESSKLPAVASVLRRTLNADELDRSPASAAVVLTVLGRIHPPTMTRVAIAYEALMLGRASSLGPLYQAKRPESVLARILHLARRYVELISPPAGQPAMSLEQAIATLDSSATDSTSRLDLKLLLGALGFFPPGTLVELNTGEVAVVMAVPLLPVDFARPPVRILYDSRMRLIEPPPDVDLAAPVEPGEPLRCLRKLVDADPRQVQQMRAYVESIARTRSGPAVAQPAVVRESPRTLDAAPEPPPPSSGWPQHAAAPWEGSGHTPSFERKSPLPSIRQPAAEPRESSVSRRLPSSARPRDVEPRPPSVPQPPPAAEEPKRRGTGQHLPRPVADPTIIRGMLVHGESEPPPEHTPTPSRRRIPMPRFDDPRAEPDEARTAPTHRPPVRARKEPENPADERPAEPDPLAAMLAAYLDDDDSASK